jgi:hypothetical protein
LCIKDLLLSTAIRIRGFAPIGMLECWNTGIMGFGELTEWVIGKITVEDEFTSFHYSTIPLFHV